MTAEVRRLLNSIFYVGTYLRYYWDGENESKGEKAAIKRIKQLLLTGELKYNRIHYEQLIEALEKWESLIPYWPDFVEDRSAKLYGTLPELHSLCKIMVSILEQVISEQSAAND